MRRQSLPTASSSSTCSSNATPAMKSNKKSTASLLGSCIAYGLTSISITLFNKAIFAVFKFEYPVFITAVQVRSWRPRRTPHDFSPAAKSPPHSTQHLQSSVSSFSSPRNVYSSAETHNDQGGLSIFFSLALGKLGVIDFGGPLSLSSARQVMPLALMWMLYVQSGLIALKYLTVPMFGVLRRATTVVVVTGEYFAFRKVPSTTRLCAVAIMVAGASLAGASDLSFSAPGYAWVSVCIAATAAYLILIQALGRRTGLNQHALLLYNNLIAFPLVIAWLLLATDEPSGVLASTQIRDPVFVVFLLVSASQAFVLNQCMFWCTTVNSPLTTTVVGQLKDVGTVGLGLFIFGDVRFSVLNLTGVVLGLAGGFVYAFGAHEEKRKELSSSEEEG